MAVEISHELFHRRTVVSLPAEATVSQTIRQVATVSLASSAAYWQVWCVPLGAMSSHHPADDDSPTPNRLTSGGPPKLARSRARSSPTSTSSACTSDIARRLPQRFAGALRSNRGFFWRLL